MQRTDVNNFMALLLRCFIKNKEFIADIYCQSEGDQKWITIGKKDWG